MFWRVIMAIFRLYMKYSLSSFIAMIIRTANYRMFRIRCAKLQDVFIWVDLSKPSCINI